MKLTFSRNRHQQILIILNALWILGILYIEWYYPKHVLGRCEWQSDDDATRIAIIADPQILDEDSYPKSSRLSLSISQYVADRYLAKHYRLLDQVLDPDSYIFLGDLFDAGREWADEPWLKEYDRFNNIFPTPKGKRAYMSLPGNHDIGFGDTIPLRALQRFTSYFGPTNQVVQLGDHNVIFLDAISLSNTNDPAIYGPAKDFLANITNLIDPKLPNVLMLHVPLFRDPNNDCGKFREHGGGLPWMQGYQYLTLIDPQISNKILTTLNPVAYFAGDDHDACFTVHEYSLKDGSVGTTDGFNVKTFAMTAGMSKPAFQMLTLGKDGYHTTICFLSSPFMPYIFYGLLSAISVAALVVKHWPKTRNTLPMTENEIKEKKLQSTSTNMWVEVGKDVLILLVTFIIGQYLTGRWIYGDM